MEFKFNYKGKQIKIRVEECKNIFEKARGLMFKKNSKPLLFYFSKLKRYRIHSFFCKPFVAIWFNNDRIIDIKLVEPRVFSIQPKHKFDKLLEIPSNTKEFSFFVEDKRNI